MKIITLILSLIFLTHIQGQGLGKKEIRRTIGLNTTIVPGIKGKEFMKHKLGVIYRQCFKGYVFQGELNTMWQSYRHTRYTLGRYDYSADTVYNVNVNYQAQRHLNTQFSLSKGWTNGVSNIYVGLGVSMGYNKQNVKLTRDYYIESIDSAYNYSYERINSGVDQSNSQTTYFYLGLVFKAGLEVKVTDRLTALIQFSPELTKSFMLSQFISEQNFKPFYRNSYSQMTTSGLEFGLHFKL